MEKSILKRVVRLSGTNHSVLHGHYNGHPFQASIYQSSNGYQVQLNGYLYQIPINTTSSTFQPTRIQDEVQAPMEGLVINILIQEGDRVHKGQTLLQLESMKLMMEIKTPCDAIIEKTFAQAGQKVEANQTLFKIQPAEGIEE